MTVSLRTRLLSGIVVGMVVLLALFCVLLYAIIHHILVDQFDTSLLRSAKMLSAVIERETLGADEDDRQNRIYKDDQERLEFDFDVGMTPEFQTPEGGAYYQFWHHDGTVILRSPSLGQRDLPYFGTASVVPVVQEAVLPDGQPGRVIGYRFTPKTEQDDSVEGRSLTLAVGRDATELNDFLAFLRWLLVSCSLVVVMLSALVGLTVTKTGLRPIHGLAAEIESVDEQSLEQSFSAKAYPPELVPICERLNALLERIRSSFERERQFNADVAHELRTPLAGIQSAIEVCLSRSRQAPEYEQTLQDCLAITRTMHRLVGTLMALSRLGGEQVSLARQSVDLKALIDERWRLFADKAHDRKLTFENRVQESLSCTSSKDPLGMIVANVLENAVEYANEEGRISVTAEETNDGVVLSISNTGCRLDPDEVHRVFDSFWRADVARTDTGTHCGIGLAVVRKVAQALGVSIEATVEQNDIFTIRLELPKDNRATDSDS